MRPLISTFFVFCMLKRAATQTKCLFVAGSGVGASSRLLTNMLVGDEEACAREVQDTEPAANGVVYRHDGRCSAIFEMVSIIADPDLAERTCWLNPAASVAQVCTLTPSACDSTPASQGGSPYTNPELTLRRRGVGGFIPTELGLMTDLELLDLSENTISGTLPTELGRLTRLNTLVAQHNSLSGSVPSELGELSRLQSLYLFGNALRGALPSQMGRLSPTWCYLSNTQWPFDDLPDTNRFDCPLPSLSAACGMNGLAFAGRDAHQPANCSSTDGGPVESNPLNAYTLQRWG